jgi:membrane protein YdbS with pleckstrin-like domain
VSEEIRPVIRPILIVNLLGYAIALGAAGALLAVLHLPWFLFSSALGLVALLVGILLGLRTASAYWRHLTERYSVEGSVLLISRGWALKTRGQVPLGNVAEAKAVVPLLLRPFRVGSVLVSTNDGLTHILFNVKDPVGFAENLRSLLNLSMSESHGL